MNHPCEDCRQSCDIPCWKVDHGLLVEPPRWIPVTEQLPEDDKRLLFIDDGMLCFTTVLTCTDNGIISMKNRLIVRPTENEYLDENVTDGWIWSIHSGNITHWMPLPEPPKEE